MDNPLIAASMQQTQIVANARSRLDSRPRLDRARMAEEQRERAVVPVKDNERAVVPVKDNETIFVYEHKPTKSVSKLVSDYALKPGKEIVVYTAGKAKDAIFYTGEMINTRLHSQYDQTPDWMKEMMVQNVGPDGAGGWIGAAALNAGISGTLIANGPAIANAVQPIAHTSYNILSGATDIAIQAKSNIWTMLQNPTATFFLGTAGVGVDQVYNDGNVTARVVDKGIDEVARLQAKGQEKADRLLQAGADKIRDAERQVRAAIENAASAVKGAISGEGGRVGTAIDGAKGVLQEYFQYIILAAGLYIALRSRPKLT